MSEQEKKELEHYRKKFSVSDSDIAISGYLAYVNIVRQMVEYIKDFNIKSNIEGKKSENAMYERTEKIWGELPEMITKMNRLKIELNIPFDPEEGKQKQQAIRPELVAKGGL